MIVVAFDFDARHNQIIFVFSGVPGPVKFVKEFISEKSKRKIVMEF